MKPNVYWRGNSLRLIFLVSTWNSDWCFLRKRETKEPDKKKFCGKSENQTQSNSICFFGFFLWGHSGRRFWNETLKLIGRGRGAMAIALTRVPSFYPISRTDIAIRIFLPEGYHVHLWSQSIVAHLDWIPHYNESLSTSIPNGQIGFHANSIPLSEHLI